MSPAIAALAGVVVFDFDPAGTILGFAVRWQFAAVAAIIFTALLLAGVIATVAERRRRARLAADPDRPAAVAEAVRAAEETVRSTAPQAAPDPAPAASADPAVPKPAEPAEPAPAAPAEPPVDPVYTGWTPGHTVPHSAGGVVAFDAAALASRGPSIAIANPALEPLGQAAPVGGSDPAAPAASTEAPATTDAAADPTAPAASTEAPADPATPAAAHRADEPPATPATPAAPAAVPPAADDRPWPVGLRTDDLLFIVAGATAGAVVFARLGWVLLYLDWYRAHTASILDTSVGGLTLAGAVVGGILAGLLMALVLGAPVARWLGVAIVPLLAALAAGKLAMVLGGAGQGLPYDGPWATAFAGPGPWGSLAPMIPSYPAQILEAATSGVALLAVLVLALVPGVRRHPAATFAIGIGLWALGRFAVASLWRDPTLVAGLNGDQLVTLGMAIVAALALLAIALRARRAARVADRPAAAGA